MRTTLDLDADVLQAVKEIARRNGKTAGQAASELLRQALNTSQGSQQVNQVKETQASYGFAPLPSRGGVVTNGKIDELRHQVGD